MGQEKRLVELVIASAFERAARDASDDDLVRGILAALRRIRITVGAQAGYSAACSLDDSIRELIVERALQRQDSDGDFPRTVTLPAPGPRSARACAIVEDAALSCIALNAFGPGNEMLSDAVRTFVALLLSRLHGVPDWLALHAELVQDGDSDEDEGFLSDQLMAPALH